ncbi:MAG: hypothetical protein Q7T71_01825, partial [Herbiconiux sp.]|nr:hypothetical protein [Herbiconiux sp.]
ATFYPGNLTEVRSVLSLVASLRHLPGPKVMTARHVADATSLAGRQNLFRMARGVLGGGGRLYLQVLVAPDPSGSRTGVRPVDVDQLVALAETYGATLVLKREGSTDNVRLSAKPRPPARRTPDDADAVDADKMSEVPPPPHLCRLVFQWN